MLVDRQKRLWIATTTSGLARLDPSDRSPAGSMLKWYGTTEGLFSESVLAMVEDGQGNLFVGTDRGINLLVPETGTVMPYAATERNMPDGIHAVRASKGPLWLLRVAGSVMMQAVERPVPPMTFITSIQVDGVARPVRADGAVDIGDLVVGSEAGRIDIEWSSPGATGLTERVRHEQKLTTVAGPYTHMVDENARIGGWALIMPPEARIIMPPEGSTRDPIIFDNVRPRRQNPRRHVIDLGRTLPGTYRFSVRSVGWAGAIGEAASVRSTLLAPVWGPYWFRIPMGLALALSIALIWYRIRAERLRGLDGVRSRIAADLHDSVGARLSRIAILSEVLRQRRPGTLQDESPELASIGDNARSVIDEMSNAVWFIDPKSDSVHDLVVRVRSIACILFESDSISWNVDASPHALSLRLNPDQRRHMFLVIKEALTNAHRHARPSNVSVRITAPNKRLHVEITDDGIGKGQQISATTGGNGIPNITPCP